MNTDTVQGAGQDGPYCLEIVYAFSARLCVERVVDFLCILCVWNALPYFEISRPPDFFCHTTRMGLATNTEE